MVHHQLYEFPVRILNNEWRLCHEGGGRIWSGLEL